MVDTKYLALSTISAYVSYLVLKELFNTTGLGSIGELAWFLSGFAGIMLPTLIYRDFSIKSAQEGVISGIVAQILGVAVYANLNTAAGLVTGDSLTGQVASGSIAYISIFLVANLLATSKLTENVTEIVQDRIKGGDVK